MAQDLMPHESPLIPNAPAAKTFDLKVDGTPTESSMHSTSQQITHCTMSEEQFAPPQNFPEYVGYHVVSVLGNGGMGVVFKAQHLELGRFVAIKTIRLDSSFRTESRERFVHEARVLAKLSHSAIVSIFEINSEAKPPYFAMEYVAGGSLLERQADYRAPAKAVELIAKIARAVHYAHGLGVLHRDLKPANIFLDEHGQPKVGDFGLAKLFESTSDLTQSGDTLGTTGYMAPEQAAGRSAEFCPATDVWALGVILFELVYGARPFVGANREATIQKILNQELGFPSDPKIDIDPKLKAILYRCLQKAPADRYPSAEALASDLEAYLKGEPIVTPALSPMRGFFKKRAKRLLIGAGLFAVCAILAAIPLLPRTPAPAVRTDPPEVLDRFKTDLAAKKTVELIGAVGTPAWYRWVTEKHREPVLAAKRAFHLESAGLCLMELLPAKTGESFHIRAEVLDSISPNGEVGIYFGHSPHPTTKGLEHWFTAQSYSETPNAEATPRMPKIQSVRYRPRTENLGQHYFRFTIREGEPLKTGERKWRSIEIKVQAGKIETYWEGKPFHTSAIEPMNHLHSSVLQPSNPTVEPPPAFDPTGGVGLYVNRAEASFRNVVVTLSP